MFMVWNKWISLYKCNFVYYFLFDICIIFDIIGIGCVIIVIGISVYIVFIYWISKFKDFNRFIGMFIVV